LILLISGFVYFKVRIPWVSGST